jgi:tetratricopeptide (TPR) repeat protein
MRAKLVAAVLVFLFSAAFFLLNLCDVPFMGESSLALSTHLGVHPFVPFDYPLWGGISRWFAGLPFGTLTWRVHALNALLGGLSVALLFFFLVNVDHDKTREELKDGLVSKAAASWLSAGFGAAYLLLSTPFWLISTRAWPMALGICLLCLVAILCQTAIRTGKSAPIFVASFIWGVGMAEHATFLLFAPAFVLFALRYAYVSRRKIDKEILARILALLLLGASLYFYTAYSIWKHPSNAWRVENTYMDCLLLALRQQKFNLFGLIPAIGWLSVVLSTSVPLVIVLIRKKANRDHGGWTSYVLHLVLAVISIGVLYGTVISPWFILKFQPLVVTPYLLTAAWSGYLAGYGWLVFTRFPRRDNALKKSFRSMMRLVYLPALVTLLAFAYAKNLRVTDKNLLNFTADWSQSVLSEVQDQGYVVSGSGLENQMYVFAHEAQKPVVILDVLNASKKAYRAYMESLFEDPRVKRLSQIGLYAVIKELVSVDPAARNNMVVVDYADLWFTAGYQPVPSHFVFKPGEEGELDLVAVFEHQRAFWATLDMEALRKQDYRENPLQGKLHHFFRLNSKLANNLGVLCQQEGQVTWAHQCYTQARAFDPDNVSVILNMYELARNHDLPDAEKAFMAYNQLVNSLAGRYNLWSLSRSYGYVYDANAYLERGNAWAMSGKPRLAVKELQRAMEMSKDDKNLRLSLANLYFTSKDYTASEAEWVKALSEDPKDRNALIGLHRISLITSQFEQAAGYLDRLKVQANKTDVGVLMEEVAQHVMLGRNSEAIPLLENVVKLEPANMQAWSALASLMVADNRVQEFKAVVKKLKRNRTLPGNLKVLLGKLLMQKREYREALNLLEQVTLMEPANINAWELLLRIDVYEGDRFRAEERVRRLLNVDPENGYGNEVLGSIQFQQRKFSAAAASYQASLRSERTPEALNSLAYVYAVTRHYDDAFPLVMESLELNPRSAPAWDTLAMVQFGLNAYEDASKSILEALTIVPNQPVYLFHQAQIFAKSGRPEQALKIANDLNAIIHNLPSDIQSELIDFLLQLRRTE